MSNGANEKLFGKYHELLLLLLGFFLTTIAGGYLAHKYQERAWEHELAAKRYDARLEAASRSFDEISRLLDRRLYRARTLLWAYKGDESAQEIQLRRNEYREVVEEWNGSLNRNLIFVERYFGQSLRGELEGEISDGFRNIHNALDAYRKSPDPSKIQDIEAKINAFNPVIYGFNLTMLEHIQGGAVGEEQSATKAGVSLRR
jgi:hypothetical protein